MKFRAYPKIQALHKEECEGLLDGVCYIQEKVDGANASIWLGEDGDVHYASRSRDLFLTQDNFNGFREWILKHGETLRHFFKEHPTYRLNGEWLVRHTIGYKEASYKQFYLFDITEKVEDLEDEIPKSMEIVYHIAESFKIPVVKLFAIIKNPTLDDIKKLAGKSVLGDKGEGVVIKNLKFINKFGNLQYGKYVTSEFKEDNAITFGGNNKTSETYTEMYYVNKFVGLPRLQKILHKLESEVGKLDMKHIPRVMGMTYYDVITEEGWTIAQEVGKSGKMFDFKEFQKLCGMKAKKIFIEILTGDVSVATKT